MADDLTNVPDIVRRQADEAMRIFNAASQAAADAGHPLDGEPPKKADEAPENTEAATEPTETPAAPVKEDDAPVAPASLSAVATEEMTKEQRYKVMEGIQKAAGRDLSRANAEARALREEVAALQSRISALSAAPPAPQVAPQADPAAANVLREQVAEAFGSENVDKFFQLMRQEGFVAKQDLDAIRGEVGNVARNVVQSAQDKFQGTMDDLAPGWMQINQEPKFIEYMNEEEGRTGMSRLEFAKLHLDRQDAHRLAQYFMDYGEAVGVPLPAKLNKKKFAAPPSTPASGKVPAEKEAGAMLKTSDMARFAREVIISRYGGNEKVMNENDTKTWNTYLTAQREGRLLEDK